MPLQWLIQFFGSIARITSRGPVVLGPSIDSVAIKLLKKRTLRSSTCIPEILICASVEPIPFPGPNDPSKQEWSFEKCLIARPSIGKRAPRWGYPEREIVQMPQAQCRRSSPDWLVTERVGAFPEPPSVVME